MSKSLVDLRPNKSLLDSSFGGYKLSLDPIPIYRKQIDSGVKVVHPCDDQFSFYHIKIFSLHNHLYVNPYKEDHVYFIDKELRVFKILLSRPNQAINLKEMCEFPGTGHLLNGSYNPSIVFPFPDIALLSNGSGAVYSAKIIGSDDAEKWEVDRLYNEEVSCVLCDARIVATNNERTLHILLSYVKEKNQEENKKAKSGLFYMKLKWWKFTESNNNWKKKAYRELSVDGNIDYVALEPLCKNIYVVSEKLPKWVYDSENPVQHIEVDPPPSPKIYTWMQTEEEITLWLPLLDCGKEDVGVAVDDLQLDIKVKENVVISNKFFQRVAKELTTWSFDKNTLEIQLTKHENGLMWKSLFQDGDNRGEEILDPEVVKTVHEKLAHLCSDKEEPGTQPSFNNQQLEDCDEASCDARLLRINGNTHEITHEASLSSLQWLFKVSCDPSQSPAMCIRHDVDACVWQFREAETDGNTWPHQHVGTFSAFGYVQASKTQKKFLLSPPNLSYVAICEASHHIYIYRQPSPLTSELKNRHTGKKVETICKQQLVNLEAKEEILGVHATNGRLFVLLENSVCILVVNG